MKSKQIIFTMLGMASWCFGADTDRLLPHAAQQFSYGALRQEISRVRSVSEPTLRFSESGSFVSDLEDRDIETGSSVSENDLDILRDQSPDIIFSQSPSLAQILADHSSLMRRNIEQSQGLTQGLIRGVLTAVAVFLLGGVASWQLLHA